MTILSDPHPCRGLRHRQALVVWRCFFVWRLELEPKAPSDAGRYCAGLAVSFRAVIHSPNLKCHFDTGLSDGRMP